MSREDIVKKVDGMVVKELELPADFDRKKNFMELGAQSISMMKLQTALLKEFGIKLKFRELFQFNTVEALSGCMAKRLQV